MKIQINPSIWNNSNEAAENVALEMKARRSGHSQYAVVYDDSVESFNRYSKKFQDAVWDLVSWARIHNKQLQIFRNANYAIALRLIEE